MAEEELTQDDCQAMAYFYKEKSLDSWCDWENKKHIAFKEFPELQYALFQLDAAQRNLDSVMDKIESSGV